MLSSGRARQALPYLERAVEGEPDSAEWRYRLGCALLESARPEAAVDALRATVAMDEEYAYGAVQLRLSEAHLGLGEAEAALAALDTFDRNHGPNPESAYRRGQALRAAGRRDEARESFAAVADLASRGARFQRGQNRRWLCALSTLPSSRAWLWKRRRRISALEKRESTRLSTIATTQKPRNPWIPRIRETTTTRRKKPSNRSMTGGERRRVRWRGPTTRANSIVSRAQPWGAVEPTGTDTPSGSMGP